MQNFAFLLAQADNGGGGAGATMLVLLAELAFLVLIIAGYWMTFTKAGEPGWASIIPIYNLIVLFRIGGKPWWWVLLLLIPLVNLVVGIIVSIDVAKNFGKGLGFAIGLAFLPMIFYPILGFGDARYQKVV